MPIELLRGKRLGLSGIFVGSLESSEVSRFEPGRKVADAPGDIHERESNRQPEGADD